MNREFGDLRDAMDEARAFLAVPPAPPQRSILPAPAGLSEAARRLFRMGVPVAGTLAETYLRQRGITAPLAWPSLRFHPSVYYRAHRDAPCHRWPALLAAVTDHGGAITGVHRTWLHPERPTKAPLADPRRALGSLLGNGVRFGPVDHVLAAGEGLETVLALKSVLPLLPMVAALSANHLAAFDWPATLARLYVARDNDAAGRMAAERLHERGESAGIEVVDLVPTHADFNVDLLRLGAARLLARLIPQLVPADAVRIAWPEDAAG